MPTPKQVLQDKVKRMAAIIEAAKKVGAEGEEKKQATEETGTE